MFSSHLSSLTILAYLNVNQSFKNGFRLPNMLLIGFSNSAGYCAQMKLGRGNDLGAFRNSYEVSLNCDSQCLLKTSVSGFSLHIQNNL